MQPTSEKPSMNFEEAFAVVIDHERGFTRDPRDNGNWTGGRRGVGKLKGTKYGISAGRYPNEDIENMTIDRARLLYKRDFWGPAGCDAVPDAVKFHLFDYAVNSGEVTAVKGLQASVGETVDGILGPLTLQAIQSTPPLRIVARLTGHRLEHMANARTWTTHGNGWARRVAKNLRDA